MFRTFLGAALLFGCVLHSSANAGIVSTKMLTRIDVPILTADYDAITGDLVLKGKATTRALDGSFALRDFRLDANFDSKGNLSVGRKGTFSIRNGSVVLLKGTITEASTSSFGPSGSFNFGATRNLGGKLSGMYQDSIALNVDLRPIRRTRLAASLFSFAPGFSSHGAAEIGRPVPAPASLFAFAPLLLVVASRYRRRQLRTVAG